MGALAPLKSIDRISFKAFHTSRRSEQADTAQRIGFTAFSIAIAFSGCVHFEPFRQSARVSSMLIDVDMLHHMLVSCVLRKNIGRRVTRRALLAACEAYLAGARKRLRFAADLARQIPGKDAPVSALAVMHSLLSVGGETLERYVDSLAPCA